MIRLIVADDHTLFRIGLRQMLHTFPDIEVVQEATNADEALAAAQTAVATGGADLLLTDLTMPGTTGTRLIESLHRQCPQLPLLVLSMHDEPAMVRRAMQAGASGYITKEATPQVLQTAIMRVANGERYIAPGLTEAISLETLNHGTGERHQSLSPREWEVLRLIVAGTSLNQIAEQLNLSPKTVTTHKTHLMEKLGVASNAELMRYAIEQKLFE
jgi:DNA-binding NarL/FixJ family response regulator